MRTGSAWTARVLAGAAVVALAACSDSNTPPTQPRLKVDRGQANSGEWTCRKAGEGTVNHVTADNRQYWVNQGYTCTKR